MDIIFPIKHISVLETVEKGVMWFDGDHLFGRGHQKERNRRNTGYQDVWDLMSFIWMDGMPVVAWAIETAARMLVAF